MKSRLVAAWVLATVVAVILTYQAVGLVQTQVTERPPILAAVEERPSTTLGSDELPSIPSTVADSVDLEDRIDEPLESVPPTTDDSTPDDSGTTTTTAPESTTSSSTPPTTATTAPEPPSSSETIASDGGWVKVLCAGDEIRLSSFLANAGFKHDVRSDGPEEVRVDFEYLSDDDRSYEIRATCDDGIVDHYVGEDD